MGADDEKRDKKYNWLKKLREAGTKVPLLDSEPSITRYEQSIIQASFACDDIGDIKDFVDLYGIKDKTGFYEIVSEMRGYNARNSNRD